MYYWKQGGLRLSYSYQGSLSHPSLSPFLISSLSSLVLPFSRFILYIFEHKQ